MPWMRYGEVEECTDQVRHAMAVDTSYIVSLAPLRRLRTGGLRLRLGDTLSLRREVQRHLGSQRSLGRSLAGITSSDAVPRGT